MLEKTRAVTCDTIQR